MKEILDNALSQTQDFWPDLIQVYQWIYAAAKILDNEEELSAPEVRSRPDRFSGQHGSLEK